MPKSIPLPSSIDPVQQRDAESLEGAKAIQALLNAGKLKTLETDLQTILAKMPADTNIAQIGRNISSVVSIARRFLDTEIPRLETLPAPSPEA